MSSAVGQQANESLTTCANFFNLGKFVFRVALCLPAGRQGPAEEKKTYPDVKVYLL